MEVWNGIWKKILVWNGISNGGFLVWNERKLPAWNMEKSSSIPYHALIFRTIAVVLCNVLLDVVGLYCM